ALEDASVVFAVEVPLQPFHKTYSLPTRCSPRSTAVWELSLLPESMVRVAMNFPTTRPTGCPGGMAFRAPPSLRATASVTSNAGNRCQYSKGENMNKYAAEFVGTFWLVLGGCGSAVLAAAFPELGIGFVGVALAFGLTVLTMAYAIGHISGCH